MPIEVNNVAPLVQVCSMKKSIHFYRDLLGFTLTGTSQSTSDDPDDVGWAMLESGPACVMLNSACDPDNVAAASDSAASPGQQDICLYFGCPDVDAAYQHLVGQGLNPDPPQVAWYGMKQLYLTDPDGFGICFQWKE
ncbi:MAG TPA: VOC family protein [Terracidiphilus sp.]|jgi:catechol 2,3-dioxygenase-like lactoylglutathione lyase family enzyme|nr:VOC family protein [Terracidiphilus sp.]